MDVRRATNNATSCVSRWRSTDAPLHALYLAGRATEGRYDDASLAPFGIRVAPSALHGMGVFATRRIPSGTRIMVLPLHYIENINATPQQARYTFQIMPSTGPYDDVSLDLYSVATANAVRFVNTCNTTPDPTNVRLDWHGCVAVIVARVHIEQGAELLLDY